MNNIINNFIKKFKNLNQKSSWDTYKEYIKIDSTAIIAPGSNIKIFNPPIHPRICFEVGAGSHVFANFNILRSEANIKIEENCQLGNSLLVAAKNIVIGNDVIMPWGVTILDSDNHSLDWEYRKNDVSICKSNYIKTNGENIILNYNWDNVKMEDIIIKDKVFIGCNVIILKDVTINEGTVIGAGSVIVRDTESWSVYAGNPAKFIKKYNFIPMIKN